VTTTGAPPVARRVRVTGVVQGVGFRPFIHRLAMRMALGGSVRNVGGEVEIAIEGTAEGVDRFLAALTREAPPLARIEEVDVAPAAPAHVTEFVIEPSLDPVGRRQPVSPDAAVCEACLRELCDPDNRRYRYPFITCTDCGPRFTIIETMPYDRERTSMRHFPPCPECTREYHAPGDRRYHSETNSCAACGPHLWFESPGRAEGTSTDAAIAAAAEMLRHDGVVAVRGLGGFHLAADASSHAATSRLRNRKRREAKPFAVMVTDLDMARTLADIDEAEAEWLRSPTRPVVVVRRRPEAALAAAVAPGLDSIGILLPSTPLHHLLLDAVGRPLVMTSGNRTEEPIAIDNDEARARLGDIADGLLLHDRDIIARYDDSVLREADGAPILLRRARGLAPLPVTLPVAAPRPLLATGADLKNTFALVDGRRAYISQHIGDLDHFETLSAFHDALHRFETLFEITPRVVAHDLHPGYRSTRIAADTGLPAIAVQHHHAHIAAVMAEHGVTDPVLGVAYDGTGYGDDGAVWGAEILLADLAGYRRLAHLRYAPLPGGDLAARQPWRAALGYLSLDPGAAPAFWLALAPIDGHERGIVEQQTAQRINAPMASSMGRLFDAASAVLGLRHRASYEGQAAMELEALAGRRPGTAIPVPIRTGDAPWIIDPVPLLFELGERRQRGDDVGRLAADFHASVIAVTADVVAAAAESTGCRTVALGGGVFQNARLATALPVRLTALGFRVLIPQALSPNDGAISFGQAAVAAARLDQSGDGSGLREV
jgi:hydrogenase maturation protein HypF